MNSSTPTPTKAVPVLGEPLPLDEHACSVALPSWADVVGYEEGDVNVSSKLLCGYPRFVYHNYCVKLMEYAIEQYQIENTGKAKPVDCIILPSQQAALRARDFIIRACFPADVPSLSSPDNCMDAAMNDDNFVAMMCSQSNVTIYDLKAQDIHAVMFPRETFSAIEAKSYWQHTGEVVSSRRAEAALLQLGVPFERFTAPFIDHPSTVDTKLRDCPVTGKHLCLHPASIEDEREQDSTTNYKQQLRERISSIVKQSPSTVHLAPSGMAAIYAALRCVRRRFYSNNSSQSVVVYGFPYLDTLKMCGRRELSSGGVEFFGHGNSSDLTQLKELLAMKKNKKNKICALITEFPSNPLLNCHDLHELRRLADEYKFALIVDDTIGNFANVDLLSSGVADVVCTSLTKLFNGRGDAIAGSIICSEKTELGRALTEDMHQNHSEVELHDADARAIVCNSQDFLVRSEQINRTAEELADWLMTLDDVRNVYYPKFTQANQYNSLRNKNLQNHKSGYGGLMSIVLEEHMCDRSFYDGLNLAKGPSLGTNFTLVCPYTLLAHYHELEFARAYDVRANLIRVAVGLEDFEELRNTFAQAFDRARLYPKLKTTVQCQSPPVVMDVNSSRNYHTVPLMCRSSSTVSSSFSSGIVSVRCLKRPPSASSYLLRKGTGNPRSRLIGLAGGMLLSSAASCIGGAV
mmetsp:Transcript_16983/g.25221  ORF Transcript_16983/g.25221 Transcript_16983/m.25221 type:complete len:689 (-) Transcript_16983:104-2170(-)